MASIEAEEVAANDSAFVDEVLDTTVNNIRVLRILPGPPLSPIRCVIKQAPLNGEHVCLSYTWGSADQQKSIKINGSSFRVRPNLWYFLDAARRDGQQLERNHQVQQMAEIYRRAQHVLVWLGQSDTALEQALGVIQTLGASGRFTRKGYQFSTKLSKHVSRMFWKAVGEIETNQYWSRLWVVQELAYSKKAHLMLGLSFCSLLYYVEFRRRMFSESAPSTARERAMRLASFDYESRKTLYHIRTMKARYDKWRPLCETRYIMDLVNALGDLDCTDEHDKIFGMLSLEHHGADFRIDYDCDLVTLFFQTLAFCQDYPAPRSQHSVKNHDTEGLLRLLNVDPKSCSSFQDVAERHALLGGHEVSVARFICDIDVPHSNLDSLKLVRMSIDGSIPLAVSIWALQDSSTQDSSAVISQSHHYNKPPAAICGSDAEAFGHHSSDNALRQPDSCSKCRRFMESLGSNSHDYKQMFRYGGIYLPLQLGADLDPAIDRLRVVSVGHVSEWSGRSTTQNHADYARYLYMLLKQNYHASQAEVRRHESPEPWILTAQKDARMDIYFIPACTKVNCLFWKCSSGATVEKGPTRKRRKKR